MNESDKVRFLPVPERQDGQRLDNFLLRELKGLPRSRIYRLIRRGEVRVNRGRCKPETRLSQGDQVRVPPYAGRRATPAGAPAEKLKLRLQDRVLFENEDLLVLNKPPGMSVHGGSGVALGLIEALRQTRSEWMEAELAHRLDKDTSGCLVIAKQVAFLRHMQAELRKGAVEKKYLALVHGAWPEELDMIDAPLRKNQLSSGERIVRADADGKRARTWFSVRERLPGASLLEVTLETGRTHQIRVHCQTAGHAVIGDSKYGQNGGNSPFIQHKYLALHAWRIAFRPAPNAEILRFEAPDDRFFSGLLAALRESGPVAGRNDQ